MLPLAPKPGVSALHAASVEKDMLLPSPNTIPSDAEIHTQKLSSICAHSVAAVYLKYTRKTVINMCPFCCHWLSEIHTQNCHQYVPILSLLFIWNIHTKLSSICAHSVSVPAVYLKYTHKTVINMCPFCCRCLSEIHTQKLSSICAHSVATDYLKYTHKNCHQYVPILLLLFIWNTHTQTVINMCLFCCP